MTQSRLMSLAEALANNAIAFVISVVANFLVLPVFSLTVTLSQSLGITVTFTAISIVRSYLVRRAFESLRDR
ncbi:hypothetical protein [uncultured Methylobacterium sp.]|jgi:membrane protein implicated in regulation of membrane protease activity|uniref:DUF7220 family protein n=1 Tax=uncultured Methylobacterium sp. TaxID=157278 RepID=UPI00262B3F2E|nr:hypothetical protein [uncultured Methylobacterium sp.]